MDVFRILQNSTCIPVPICGISTVLAGLGYRFFFGILGIHVCHLDVTSSVDFRECEIWCAWMSRNCKLFIKFNTCCQIRQKIQSRAINWIKACKFGMRNLERVFFFFSYIKKTKPSDTLVQRERCVTSPLRDRERAKSLSSKIFYFSFWSLRKELRQNYTYEILCLWIEFTEGVAIKEQLCVY